MPTKQRQPETNDSPEHGSKRPEVSFKYPSERGTKIEVAVWANEVQGKEGTFVTYSTTVKRSYLDKDETWKTNASFRGHDLPVLLHALNKAYEWILEKRKPDA
jgi:hypothetical protein